MKDRDLESMLEGWAQYEVRSAPEMNPVPAMYQVVMAHRDARKSSPFFRRWLAISTAVAALLVLTVIYPALFRPPPETPLWSGSELEIVGLREIHMSKKGAARAKEVSPGSGPKREAFLFRRLEFQFREQDSPAVVSVDFMGPREEAISLTAADNYRLLIEPAADLYTYVFQVSPSSILVKLFPNDIYSPDANPLARGAAYYLPCEPSWFHPGPHTGHERLYLLASTRPLARLDSLYAEYRETNVPAGRPAMLRLLLDHFEDMLAGGRDDAGGWMFDFQHR